MERSHLPIHGSAKGLLSSSASLVELSRVNESTVQAPLRLSQPRAASGISTHGPIDIQPAGFKANSVQGCLLKVSWKVCHPGPATGGPAAALRHTPGAGQPVPTGLCIWTTCTAGLYTQRLRLNLGTRLRQATTSPHLPLRGPAWQLAGASLPAPSASSVVLFPIAE